VAIPCTILDINENLENELDTHVMLNCFLIWEEKPLI
jgi:hypothetical protein